jgi:hypothetical protein
MEGATVVPGAPDTGVPEVRVPDIRVPEVRVPGVRVADLEEAMDTARAEVAVIAGRLNRAHADLVALTGRLVEGQLWAGGGIRSPEHWLILTAGLSPAHARDVVRLARRRQEIAPALALLDQGQLSIHQAAEIARHAPASHADSVTEFARHATVPQLHRVLARYPFPTEPDHEEPDSDQVGPDHPEPDPHDGALDAPANGAPAAGDGQDRQQPRFVGPPELVVKERAPASLAMGFDAGRFRLVYDAPADLGALVETAVREAKDALFTAGQTQATLGDALTEVAHRSLSTVASRSRRDHYRVLVHWKPPAGGSTTDPPYPPTWWTS